MQRADQTLTRNLEKQPDNQGLQNARDRLRDNQRRFDLRRESKAGNQLPATSNSATDKPTRTQDVVRPERSESVQRPERVEKPERVERPERPERPERVERPEPPQRGHRR